ncbi:MAG TPA: EAL domain-containing protein [Mariprofundaceae bacterium]|nr:EAL domain-containing protein [Mariprofundaceae bacterium]
MVIMIAVVLAELLIMLLLNDAFAVSMEDTHMLGLAMTDTLSLGLVVSPVVYFTLLLPLRRKTILEQESMRALRDDLTGLPTRRLFEEMIQHEIDAANRNLNTLAVIVIDPARLSEVNQIFGYTLGDRIITAIGERLKTLFRKSDFEARISGDEFAVLLPEADETSVAGITHNISQALHEPFEVDDVSVNIGVTMGVSVFPHHATDASSLIQRARIALSKAKSDLELYAIFDHELESDTQDRVRLYGEIRRAIEEDAFKLHYQPKVYLDSQRLAGVEALIRWPEASPQLAAKLITFSEQVGLIDQITKWIVSEAVWQMGRWQDEGHVIPVSVNISARDLLHSDICDYLPVQCETYRVSPELVTIEVTESSVMEHPEKSFELLRRMRSMGFRVAIDDFGTGYSSLTYLRDMPADELKIDQSFIMALDGDPKSHVLVSLIVQLGRKFGLKVVAEGVENESLLRHLKEDGCQIGQGYHFLRPQPAGELIRWYVRHSSEIELS